MDSDGATTHVVVTCSNRKRLMVPFELTVGSLPRSQVGRRASEWIERLEHSDAPFAPAADLYAGEHWSVVRSLRNKPSEARNPVTVWILSAGYGFISCDALVHPYAATFSVGHVDSVASNGSRGSWWRALSEWLGPEPGAPRSLTELAQQNPSANLVVAVSPPYLDACSDDLASAAVELARREQLSIICMGASRKTLREHMLPGDARLQHALGGTRQALNARVLAYLVAEHGGSLTRDRAAATLETLLTCQPALVRYDRERCSDADVRSYIRARLRTDPSLSRGRLLRELRDLGKACEQARFASLFDSVSSQS